MGMGFILPFALVFVAIPLETFVHSLRTVLGLIGIGILRAVFETNFFGAISTTHHFLPLLQKSGAPVIVNVSSELGSFARHTGPGRNPNWDNFDAYSCSKTALNAFTVALANQFRKDTQFRINSVTPGFTATDLNQNSGPQTVRQGAAHIVKYATIGPDGPTGNFFRDEALDW